MMGHNSRQNEVSIIISAIVALVAVNMNFNVGLII